ncbi:MAG: ABC transporter ATP-binding protein [Thermoplasmata archaeon]|nr:ABC transporter ATP-binding protein [Thermoplasmata archaeon]
MANAIEVRGLVKRYDALAAVDGIDFDVPEGSVFAFLGPNGAGKTTTTEMLEGLRRRTSGDIRVLGLDPWTDGRELHRQIGVIPQEFHFFAKVTPKEAIAYYGRLFDKQPDPDALLDQVQLTDKADSRFDTLSGGQKQKLGLALSLVDEPRVCFLDEPTTGLDPHARRAIWNVVRDLRRDGRTVFLTTHYLEEAELLADQVAIINHGRIVAHGTPQEIIETYGGPERLRVQGSSELAEYVRQRLGIPVRFESGRLEIALREKGDALRILSAIDASGFPWTGFATERDTLEEVFVHLVGQMDEGVLKSAAPTVEGTP